MRVSSSKLCIFIFSFLLLAGCGGSGAISVPSPTSIPYYVQFEDAEGIVIKAASSVQPEALEKAREIAIEMLSGDEDIRERLVTVGAAIAIIPRDAFITNLPEFSHLSGRLNRSGQAYDSFAIRGLGAARGQSLSAISEENLLRLPVDPSRGESVLHHEFAHAIMDVGFNSAMHAQWSEIYENAVQAQRFSETLDIPHARAYFAELSLSFFSVNDERLGSSDILAEDPEAYAFLQSIYARPLKQKRAGI